MGTSARSLSVIVENKKMTKLLVSWWFVSVLFTCLALEFISPWGVLAFMAWLSRYLPVFEKIRTEANFPESFTIFYVFFTISSPFVLRYYFSYVQLIRRLEGIQIILILFADLIVILMLTIGREFYSTGRGVTELIEILINYGWITSSIYFLLLFHTILITVVLLKKNYTLSRSG